MENARVRKSNILIYVICLLFTIGIIALGLVIGIKQIEAAQTENAIKTIKFIGTASVISLIFTNLVLFAALVPAKVVSPRNRTLWAYLFGLVVSLLLLIAGLIICINKFDNPIYTEVLIYASALTIVLLLITIVSYFNRPTDMDRPQNGGLWVYLFVLDLALLILGVALYFILSKNEVEKYRIGLWLVSILFVFVLLLTILARLVMNKKAAEVECCECECEENEHEEQPVVEEKAEEKVEEVVEETPAEEEKNEEETDEEEEEETTTDELDEQSANRWANWQSLPFDQKLEMSSDETKKYFEEIINYCDQTGISHKQSKTRVRIYKGRKTFAQIKITHGVMKMYFALDESYVNRRFGTSYIAKKAYEETPLLLKIKTDRGVQRAKNCLDELKGSN